MFFPDSFSFECFVWQIVGLPDGAERAWEGGEQRVDQRAEQTTTNSGSSLSAGSQVRLPHTSDGHVPRAR